MEDTVTVATSALDSLTLTVTQEIHVRASLTATFDALIEQIGPGNETPEGLPLPMTIEPRPGGRWFRDLGQDDGHFWGTVQAIKRPTLLEITGPLFMSAPVVSNVQYRLKEADGGTLISFRHAAFGLVPEEVRANLSRGWTPLLERIRARAEHPTRAH
jgi:activator of Hsp90 ATPase-like protein